MVVPEHIQRRGLITLLVFTFFMVIGFTLVMPLVAVHFVNNLGFAAATVGLALALRQLTQQGLALVGGMLADRFGARQLICFGVLVRALGFSSLAFANDIPTLFVAMLLSALGGVLFEVPYQSAIATLTTEENRPRYYSLSNFVSGVATTLGPLLGVLLLRFDFRWVCLVAAACFGITFLLAFFLIPPITLQAEKRNMGYGLGLVLRDRAFITLTLLMMGYWFAAMQINISFPLLAEQLTGSPDSVGVMFSLNAGMTVLLQVPLIHLLTRWFQPRHVLVLGVLIMALGIGAVALAPDFVFFLACVAVFSLGALLTRPTQQTLTAAMADSRAMGTYLGVSSLALAFGGGMGNFMGGWLVDIAAQTGWAALPWLVFCVVSLVSAIGLALLRVPRPAAASPLPHSTPSRAEVEEVAGAAQG